MAAMACISRSREVEMTIGDDESEIVRHGSDVVFSPEAKRRKIEAGVGAEMGTSTETDDDDDDDDDSPDSVIVSRDHVVGPSANGISYLSLDDILASELGGYTTTSFERWSQGPIIDAQYKDLYDYLKEYHFDQVVTESPAIFSWSPCTTRDKANVFAMKYEDCTPRLTKWDIDECLKDLVSEHEKSEELRICKEYEVFILRSGYWQYKDFERWIFQLKHHKYEEKIAAIESDDKNRRTKPPIWTRAEYITKKLERAERLGIISMVDLKSEIQGQKLQPKCAGSANCSL